MADEDKCSSDKASISPPAWAFVAWLWDRREQYKPSSGTYAAFDELIGAAAEGAHIEAWRHGELDDLRATAENVIAKARPSVGAAPKGDE